MGGSTKESSTWMTISSGEWCATGTAVEARTDTMVYVGTHATDPFRVESFFPI